MTRVGLWPHPTRSLFYLADPLPYRNLAALQLALHRLAKPEPHGILLDVGIDRRRAGRIVSACDGQRRCPVRSAALRVLILGTGWACAKGFEHRRRGSTQGVLRSWN
jgi:hypothetical protein